MSQTEPNACFNGQILPLNEIAISPSDRGFLYGDSLFETVRVHAGKPFRWEQHMARLSSGADIIDLRLPFSADEFLSQTERLIQQSANANCIMRLAVSRGAGERGYGFTGDEQPNSLIAIHPLPKQNSTLLSLVSTDARVAKDDPLARIKSSNKLGSILAKRLAKQNGADDGLILNSDGNITETSSANVFWTQDGILRTPPVTDGVLPGVTRELVIDLAAELGQAVREESVSPSELQQAEAVFATNTATGIRAVGQVDGFALPGHPLVEQLVEAYDAELARHTSHAG